MYILDSLVRAVRVNDVAVTCTECAGQVPLKWVQKPLHLDGDIVKDSSQLAHKQVKT